MKEWPTRVTSLVSNLRLIFSKRRDFNHDWINHLETWRNENIRKKSHLDESRKDGYALCKEERL